MLRNFEKCERCRKSPATVECEDCGTGNRDMKFCYDCDKQYHQMFEKTQHARKPIKFETGKINDISYVIQLSPLRNSSPLRQRVDELTIKSPKRYQQQQLSDDDYMRTTQYPSSTSNSMAQQRTNGGVAGGLGTTGYKSTLFSNAFAQQKDQSLFSPKSTREQEDEEILYSSRGRENQLTSSALRQTQRDKNLSLINLQQIPIEAATLSRQPQPLLQYESQHSRSFQAQQQQNQQLQRSGFIEQYQAPPQQQLLQPQYQQQAPPQLQFNPTTSMVQLPQPPYGSDLATYYQKLADEYRNRYLEVEKDLVYLKNQTDYEIQKSRNAAINDCEQRFNDRMRIDHEDAERRFREIINEKDRQIDQLQRQLSDVESRMQKEGKELVELQRLQNNLELDYKQTYRDFEGQMKEKDDKFERLKKESETQVKKLTRVQDEEKEKMKKDYEDLLKSVRDEYQGVNQELRQTIEQKNKEIETSQVKLQESSLTFKKEKNEYQEVLSRDQYNIDLQNKENEQLRQAKQDFDQERARMYGDIKQLESENDRFFCENKELRKKVKKLEHIIYGRK